MASAWPSKAPATMAVRSLRIHRRSEASAAGRRSLRACEQPGEVAPLAVGAQDPGLDGGGEDLVVSRDPVMVGRLMADGAVEGGLDESYRAAVGGLRAPPRDCGVVVANGAGDVVLAEGGDVDQDRRADAADRDSGDVVELVGA